MIFWIILSVILFFVVIYLLYRLGKRAGELALLKKQEERAWTLKVALEKTFHLPTVEAKELEKIEPQIDRIMSEQIPNNEMEEKMRQAVMELYAQKAERGAKEAPNKDAASRPYPPIVGRGK